MVYTFCYLLNTKHSTICFLLVTLTKIFNTSLMLMYFSAAFESFTKSVENAHLGMYDYTFYIYYDIHKIYHLSFELRSTIFLSLSE